MEDEAMSLRLRISTRTHESEDASAILRFTGDGADVAAQAAALWASSALLTLLSDAPQKTATPSLN